MNNSDDGANRYTIVINSSSLRIFRVLFIRLHCEDIVLLRVTGEVFVIIFRYQTLELQISSCLVTALYNCHRKYGGPSTKYSHINWHSDLFVLSPINQAHTCLTTNCSGYFVQHCLSDVHPVIALMYDEFCDINLIYDSRPFPVGCCMVDVFCPVDYLINACTYE